MRANPVVRFVVASLLVSVPPLQAQEQTTMLAGRSVVVWHPHGAANERHPIIVFSHGYGGCATQSRFLTAALADRGYWVFAPNHKDARRGQRGGNVQPDEPFREPKKWSEQTFADRRDDIRAMLQAIANAPEYAGLVDLDRVGLAGHSLGGYTVVGLGGGWASWMLPGVKAVLALSSFVDPFVVHNTLSGAYDSSPKPKCFVELTRAGHFAWTNIRPDAHQRILDYALPFLDHYVRGQAATAILTKTDSGISELRYQSELGASPAPRTHVRR